MSKFNLEILTPFGHYYKGEADYLQIKNNDGVLGILSHHTTIITTVVLGKVVVVINGNRHTYATTGGLLNMKKDNTAVLMLNTIERSDEIDVERAKRSKERAQERIKNNEGNIKRAEESLKRAENRLDVANDK